jgi:ubiquinone/menaquinone biosynthesis C-methylase UbiE
MRLETSWIFDLGADIYGWFTAQAAWRASCARLAEHLPAGDRLRVADLGCGPGVSAIELARRRPGDLIIGLDVSPRMLAVARRRLASARLPAGHVHWVRGDAARLPFGTGSLDALTGHSFLYLLPEREAALAESLRVLQPGGRLVLMEPNARPATAAQVLGVSRDPRHLVSVGLWRPFSRFHGRFTAASLTATLEGAGFVSCRVEEVLGGLGLMAWAEKP